MRVARASCVGGSSCVDVALMRPDERVPETVPGIRGEMSERSASGGGVVRAQAIIAERSDAELIVSEGVDACHAVPGVWRGSDVLR